MNRHDYRRRLFTMTDTELDEEWEHFLNRREISPEEWDLRFNAITDEQNDRVKHDPRYKGQHP